MELSSNEYFWKTISTPKSKITLEKREQKEYKNQNIREFAVIVHIPHPPEISETYA